MNKLYLIIITVLTVALIFTAVMNHNQVKAAGVEYEYKAVPFAGRFDKWESQINFVAKDGWRLTEVSAIGQSGAIGYFEREVR